MHNAEVSMTLTLFSIY